MDWVAGGTMIVAVCALVSAGYSIWRNGRSQRDKFTEVKTELKAIKDTVNNPDYGLQSQGQKLNNHLVNCAKISTGLGERVKQLEEDRRSKRRK